MSERRINIEDIRIDGGTQPRMAIDDDYVCSLHEVLNAGGELPAVVLFYDGSEYWLADGFHRHEAHCRAERKAIAADVRQGTKEDAQWYSYSANKQHDSVGLRRTNDDKERAVRAALGHSKAAGMSNVAIAEWVGVGEATVRRYRKEAESASSITKVAERQGRDGKTYNVSNIGHGRKSATNDGGDDSRQSSRTTKEIVNTDTGEVLENAAVATTATIAERPEPTRRQAARPTIEGICELVGQIYEMTRKPFNSCPYLRLQQTAAELQEVCSRM